MQTLAQIKQMLESRGLAPRKSLGQNFLIDHNLIRKLVDAANVKSGEVVLEVGPGTGALTGELLERGVIVIAAEMDVGLSVLLRERFGEFGDRFTLVEGDCLRTKHELAPGVVAGLAGRPFVLVANLPYGAATPVMSILMADYPSCRGLFVTIQREVADRLAAKPGSKDYGTLSVLAACVAEFEHIATLPPACFWPRPDVTSAMIGLRRRTTPLAEPPRELAAFCQRLFEHRRKQIGSILGRQFAFPPGISAEARAEQLSLEQFIALWRADRATG
ncbi:MAG: ribosomal RNA small subunit methyltransferase A [Planctomycetes bacterium]|nr:ribosomal RNA small subunit methyltransferase A [Planctomycetota bacterium]